MSFHTTSRLASGQARGSELYVSWHQLARQSHSLGGLQRHASLGSKTLAGRTEENAKASILRAFSSHAWLPKGLVDPLAQRCHLRGEWDPRAPSCGCDAHAPRPSPQVTSECRRPPNRETAEMGSRHLSAHTTSPPREPQRFVHRVPLPAWHCSRPQGCSGEPPKTPGGQGRGGRWALRTEQNRDNGELGQTGTMPRYSPDE